MQGLSGKKLARSYGEQLVGLVIACQRLHPGAVDLGDVAQWAINEGRWEIRRQMPVAVLTRELKRAASESRVTDAQGRTVRALLPAKIERVDGNGNRIFDIVWDHVFSMSAHHALLFLSQQYENIEKQCRSHNRVRESVLDNNPNCRELQLGLFDYDFRYATGGGSPQIVEKVSESPINPT